MIGGCTMKSIEKSVSIGKQNSSGLFQDLQVAAKKGDMYITKEGAEKLDIALKKKAEEGSTAQAKQEIYDIYRQKVIKSVAEPSGKTFICPVCGNRLIATGYVSTHRGGEQYYTYCLKCTKSFEVKAAQPTISIPEEKESFKEIDEISFVSMVE